MIEYKCRGIVAMFPRSWRTDVVVKQSGGRDGRGNPKPATEALLKGALVGSRSSTEPVAMGDTAEATIVLYHDTPLVLTNKDRIIIPDGHRMSGTWEVFGRPAEWPLGTEVVLKAG